MADGSRGIASPTSDESVTVIDWQRVIDAGLDVPTNPLRWSIADFGQAYAVGAVELAAIETMARWAA